jgi:hypothetical protein
MIGRGVKNGDEVGRVWPGIRGETQISFPTSI